MSNTSITIEHYTAERLPNPFRGGNLPWQTYQSARNRIVQACRRFGGVGPMGECPIRDSEAPSLDDWPLGDPDPVDFYVVDDQFNDECYIYIEVERASAFTATWVHAMMNALTELPDWRIGVGVFRDGYMIVAANKLAVTGSTFVECNTVESVVAAAKRALMLADSNS
jgi:hypothetical protein